MAVTYTTAALVRKRIEDIDASLIDADIDQYIYEAEGIINAHSGFEQVCTASLLK